MTLGTYKLHTLPSIPAETLFTIAYRQQVQYGYSTALYTAILALLFALHAASRQSATSSVEAAVIVVGAGAREGGTGFIPWKGPRVVSCGKAQGAGTLQFVLQTPADEGWLLGYIARLGVLVIFVICQTYHGVGLRQVSAESGTLGRLDRESDNGISDRQ